MLMPREGRSTKSKLGVQRIKAGLKTVHWIFPGDIPGLSDHSPHFTKRHCKIVVKSGILPPDCLFRSHLCHALAMILEKFYDLLRVSFLTGLIEVIMLTPREVNE